MSAVTSEGQVPASVRLNAFLAHAGLEPLDSHLAGRFENYLSLLVRWNARMNLTSIRDDDGILSRHFVESIACARALPAGIATLLDFGSGAGFPGIPITLCRPEIAVTLAESQGKKAAFLREAVRTLGLPCKIHSGRAESLTVAFDCITLRAVERMPQAVQVASGLVSPGGYLALMTTDSEFDPLRTGLARGFVWQEPVPLPGSEARLLALARSKTDATS